VTQFTVAKLVSTFGLYIIPWSVLLAAALTFVAGRSDIPNGVIPVVLILMALTFIGFCIVASVALVSESEGATIAATVGTNTFYGFGWYLLVRNAAIREGMKSPVIVWSNEVLTVLGIELATIGVILAITLYLQSRKRDFV
jgi:hypothetical protein